MPVSPTTLIILAILFGALGVGASMLAYQRYKSRRAQGFYFDAQGAVVPLTGNSYAGLVSHEDGGFIERPGAVINMHYGRALWQVGNPDWRRRRRPVYLTAAGHSAPLQIDAATGQVTVDNVKDEEYEQRVDLAAELAIRDAAKKANRGDLLSLTLGATLILMALGLTGIVAAVAVKGSLNG